MISFRPIERRDLLLLKEWRNSDSVMPYCREYRYLNESDQEAWYNSYLASRRKADFDQEILIGETTLTPSSSNIVAAQIIRSICVGGFTRIEWKNRKAEFTFYQCPNINNQDLIKQSINKLLDKGFKEFGFHKITWPVYGHDTNLKIYQSLFVTEAILMDEYWYDGWKDRYYLSKLNLLDDNKS